MAGTDIHDLVALRQQIEQQQQQLQQQLQQQMHQQAAEITALKLELAKQQQSRKRLALTTLGGSAEVSDAESDVTTLNGPAAASAGVGGGVGGVGGGGVGGNGRSSRAGRAAVQIPTPTALIVDVHAGNSERAIPLIFKQSDRRSTHPMFDHLTSSDGRWSNGGVGELLMDPSLSLATTPHAAFAALGEIAKPFVAPVRTAWETYMKGQNDIATRERTLAAAKANLQQSKPIGILAKLDDKIANAWNPTAPGVPEAVDKLKSATAEYAKRVNELCVEAHAANLAEEKTKQTAARRTAMKELVDALWVNSSQVTSLSGHAKMCTNAVCMFSVLQRLADNTRTQRERSRQIKEEAAKAREDAANGVQQQMEVDIQTMGLGTLKQLIASTVDEALNRRPRASTLSPSATSPATAPKGKGRGRGEKKKQQDKQPSADKRSSQPSSRSPSPAPRGPRQESPKRPSLKQRNAGNAKGSHASRAPSGSPAPQARRGKVRFAADHEGRGHASDGSSRSDKQQHNAARQQGTGRGGRQGYRGRGGRLQGGGSGSGSHTHHSRH
jgi:hypothetical protein